MIETPIELLLYNNFYSIDFYAFQKIEVDTLHISSLVSSTVGSSETICELHLSPNNCMQGIQFTLLEDLMY